MKQSKRLMASGVQSRGEAISILRQHYDAGSPKVARIPDIQEKLALESVKGQFEHGYQGFFNRAAAPIHYAAELGTAAGIPGSRWMEGASQISDPEVAAYEPSPGAQTVGEMGGTIAGAGEVGNLLEAPISMAARLGVPGAAALGGASLPARMARAGAGGGIAAGTGAFGPSAGVLPNAALGSVFPLLEDALSGLTSRIMTCRTLAGAIGEREGIAPTTPSGPTPYVSQERAAATGEAPAGYNIGQPRPMPPGPPPIGQPNPLPSGPFGAPPPPPMGPFQPIGQPNPMAPGPFTPPEAPPPPEPTRGPGGGVVTPAGLSNAMSGQSFDVTEHMVQIPGARPGTFRYVGKDNPLAIAGKVSPAHFNKIYHFPIPIGGEAGYRDAARMAYSTNEGALSAIDNAKDPIAVSEELLGRWAKGMGYDGVVLETPDLDDNILLDYCTFKSTPHPEITKEVTGFRKSPKPRPLLELLPKAAPEVEKAAQGVSEEFMEPDYMASGNPALAPADDVVAQAVLGNLDAQHIEIQNAARYMQDKSLSPIARMRPPAAARDTVEHNRYFQDVYEKMAIFGKREWTRIGRQFARVRGKGFAPEDFDEIARAMHGLDYDADGKLVQYDPSVSNPCINKMAQSLFRIKDRMYTIRTGNNPQVPSILERYAIQHNEVNIKRLKLLQDPSGEIILSRGPRPPSIQEQLAARETMGMLNFQPWHNLNMEHIQGFLNISPVENERAMLEQQIRESLAQQADGVLGPDGKTEMASYQEALERIKHIDTEVQRDAMRNLPSRDYLPKRAFYGPTALAQHPEARAIFTDKNPDVVFEKWVRGNLRAAQSDYILWRTRGMVAAEPGMDASTKEFYTDFANIVRGSTGYRGDAKFARWWNRTPLLRGHEMTSNEAHDITNFILGWQAQTKLFMLPFRFPVINLSHPFVTLYPVVGEKYFSKGLARVLSRPVKAFEEALAAGDIGHESQWFEEIGKQGGKVGVLQRLMRTPTYWTENFRIVLAREAALAQAADGIYSPLVRGFDKDTPGLNQVQRARAYARAMVATTQFRFGPEGKPMAFTGSPVRRLVSQFRTWPAGIGLLYADMIRLGDYKGLARGLGAMFVMGGLPAILGGPSAFKMLQHQLMKHGHYLPDQSGFQMGIEAAGLGGTGLESADILSLREPFELMPYSISGMFGPALGSTVDTAATTWSGLQEDNYRKVVSQWTQYLAGPQAVAAGQAAGQLWNHGEVFGPSGELEATRPILATLVRGVDWSPSTRSQVFEYQEKMADAVESGNESLIRRIVAEAQERGIIINEAGVRSILARRGKQASPW